MDSISIYGKLYSEIAQSYSVDFFQKKEIYFKHPSVNEHFNIYNNYDVFIEKAKQRGILTEEEKISEAIKNKWWDSNRESQYQMFKKTIDNLLKTRDKLLYLSQKQELDLQIRKTESIYLTYLKQRKDIVGYTIEQYANDKFFDELIFNLSYRDQNLTKRFFEDINEYYDLIEEDTDELRKKFTKKSNNFTNENIKLIAACGFFQNLVYITTEPVEFWGKSITKCSKYQIDLLIYGKMFRKFIEGYSQSGKSIPEYILSDPEKLVQWVDNQSNSKTPTKIKSKKVNSENAVSSFVGATTEDLNNLGVNVEKIGGKSLLQLAREKGGTLEKSDYLHVRENS